MSVFVLQGSEGHARKINYHAELNQEQLDVVLHGDGPCLVLAGAGSGKTRTITYRVSYLIEQGVDPSKILLLTFTNKAAKEMLQRVSLLLGHDTRGIWGGTFHSIGNRLLRAFAEELGYNSRFTILDSDDSQSLLKAILKELNYDPKARRFPTAAVLQNIISFSRNTEQSLEETLEIKHPNFLELANEIREVAHRYGERKKIANAMDFDDLLTNLLVLLKHPRIGEHISSQFEYVLVDEYQDTNAIQSSIVLALAQVHANLLVVGDDAQSIYAFRGADVKNILSFPRLIPGTKMFKLLTNYRSVPEILDLANDSLSHNEEQFQKELIAMREKGKKPVVVPAASARQEAQFIAEQILQLRNEGTALGNMAVLFRSSAHSQALEFELMKRDIPYEYRGGMKFFERAHIKDALSYIRIFQNLADETAWLRVMNLQTGIGAATAMQVTNHVKLAPDLRTVVGTDVSSLLSTRAKKGWEEFVGVAQGVVDRAPAPAEMLRAVLNSNYQDYLEREYPDWKERLEDLEQLIAFAEGYQDVSAFLADIALYDDVLAGRDKEAEAGTDERIVLTTIHQAKGLEWDTVFIIHLSDYAFPNKRAMTEEGGMEEERRLFYVAVTRARRRLFLSYPITMGFDTMILNQPSLFLEEVSPQLFERMELREARNTHALERGQSSWRRGGEEQGWNWDEGSGYEEPTISVDTRGERNNPPSSTMWKSNSPKKGPSPGSFLRDVGDL
jgi:DNA helicase II / ATP-dependent DNA helicase PcrA